MKNIDASRRALSKEFAEERLFDLRTSSIPGIDFWDEVDNSISSESETLEAPQLKAEPYDLEIEIGDIRVCAHTHRITYVAVIDRIGCDKWLIIPFSRYDNPASEREFISDYAGGGLLTILQLWNAREYSSIVLEKSWRLPSPMSPEDLLKTKRLLYGLKKKGRIAIPEETLQRTGLTNPDDENLVNAYEQEESENFAEMDKEETLQGKPTSNVFRFSKWINYSAVASLAFVVGVVVYDWNLMQAKGVVFASSLQPSILRSAHSLMACGAIATTTSLTGDVFSTTPDIVVSDGLQQGIYEVQIKGDDDFVFEGKYEHAFGKKLISWKELFGEKELPRDGYYTLSFYQNGFKKLQTNFEVLSEEDALEVARDLDEIKAYWKFISKNHYDYARAAVYYEQNCYSDACSILYKLVESNPENEKYRDALNLTLKKLN